MLHPADPTSPGTRPTGRAIEAFDLVKTYPGGVRALDGVSLSVDAGSIFGLLGPNGAGKSTAVKVLTTLSRADSGSASVAGHDVARHPDRVRRAIGAVGQKSAVDRTASGRENLNLQARIFGMRGADLRDRVVRLLDQFSLTEAADRIVQTWSGGMQRKLDVAMGLVHRPSVLFLDEPSTGLDPDARAELWTEITRLATVDGLTILLTTHYLDEADRLAARLAIIDRGRLVTEGTPEALKAELKGDAINIQLSSADGARDAARVLERIDGMGAPTLDGTFVSARADHAATAIPAVLSALDAAGVAVAAITVARPSLDDVYMRHTGRTYRPTTMEASR